MQVSVARYLRTPPYAAKRKGLSFGYPSCLRSQSDRSTVVVGNCTFGPITVVPHRAKAGLFSRSSILFRPPLRPTSGVLVEPPGTAPGSDPIITGAFIAIVRANPNIPDIGRGGALRKGGAAQQKGPDALGGPGPCTGMGKGSEAGLDGFELFNHLGAELGRDRGLGKERGVHRIDEGRLQRLFRHGLHRGIVRQGIADPVQQRGR